MAERYLILSDLHLGKDPKRLNPALLRPLWRRGDHLIINGDLAEIHDPRYQDHACPMVLLLQDLCQADGVTLTLLAGNHDPGITPRRHLFLSGGQVLVTHGDAVNPSIAPWCVTAPLMREAYDDALATLPVESHDELETQLWATRKAAGVKWEQMRRRIGWIGLWGLMLRPWSFVQILHYWRVYPREAADWAREFAPGVKYLITGHTHRQGVWTNNGVTVINTGCYAFPGKPRAAVLCDETLAVHKLRRGGEGYHLAETPLASFTLDPVPTPSPGTTPPPPSAEGTFVLMRR